MNRYLKVHVGVECPRCRYYLPIQEPNEVKEVKLDYKVTDRYKISKELFFTEDLVMNASWYTEQTFLSFFPRIGEIYDGLCNISTMRVSRRLEVPIKCPKCNFKESKKSLASHIKHNGGFLCRNCGYFIPRTRGYEKPLDLIPEEYQDLARELFVAEESNEYQDSFSKCEYGGIKMFNVKVGFNGIDVEVGFKNKVNILQGNAGTGKTLICKAIRGYCVLNDISCAFINYRYHGKTTEEIVSACKDCDVVLLDNADLYLTNDILTKLKETAKVIIMVMQYTYELDVYDADRYFTSYENKKVRIRK